MVRKLGFLSVALVTVGTMFGAMPPVPRKAPELAVEMPGNKQLLLSSYRGKVVLLEFLFTTCPHCQKAAQMISQINSELGPKGLQPIGVAINEGADRLVGNFVATYQPNFPVGYSKMEVALTYLGLSPIERWVVPQIVLIDRQGQIRYQTPAQGDEQIQNPTVLKQKLLELLNESASKSGATKTSAKPAAAAKAPAKKAS
jgi:thiol-disulfide isomerase/thioredoxin